MSGSALRPLVARSLARGRRVVLAGTAVLAAFQVMVVVIASSLQQLQSFNLLSAMMPMGVQQALGSGALMIASFPGLVTFGFFHPIVVLAVIQLGVYAATEPAGEVEWGLFDLELARPLRRRTIITRSWLVAFGTTAATTLAMAGGSWAGLFAFAPAGATWPQPDRILSLAAHLLFTAWFFAAAGLAAAAFARRRGTAFGAVAGAAVLLDLLNVVADAWSPAAGLRPLMPFHYFPGFAVANGAAPIARDLSVLGAGALVLVAVAYWKFERRDL
jgi:ABC-type transport system involved in multi-copper enzyme maturation permease subunit